MRKIYLDYNATTPLAPEAFRTMQPYLTGFVGNASSIHWAGEQAKRALERARQQVAQLLGARPAEIVFTSGATESINTVLKGLFVPHDPARYDSERGRIDFGRARGVRGAGARIRRQANGAACPPVLLTSAVEHQATIEAAERLVSWGISVQKVPVDAYGRIDPEEVAYRLTPATRLVSLLWANNETGNLYPVEAVAALCREKGVLLHVDAAQAAGKVPIDLAKIPIDFLSLSAHKIYGPQGVGALFIRTGRSLPRLHDGGGQERNRRGGTENIAGIVGLGVAAELAQERLSDDRELAQELVQRLETGIRRHFPDAIRYGDPTSRLANTLLVGFPGISNESLLIALDLAGVAASSGAACSSGTIEPSHVLRAMGVPPAEALSAVRFSVGRHTEPAEIDRLLEILPSLVKQLKAA